MEPRIDVRIGKGELAESLRHDVYTGLTGDPKTLPPRWLYDTAGSELFEKITALAEYYPTRAEAEILGARAAEIAALTGARSVVELGSGSSEKTRTVLAALLAGGTLREFVPLDVSESALREATDTIAAEWPELAVHGVVGDFTDQRLYHLGQNPRMVVFLGGTIGNFAPSERVRLLESVRAQLGAGEWLLLGADLVKERETLLAAYDDAAGVTAEFNRNMLRVLNRELGADFDLDSFEHVAYWDGEREWIEMRLRAQRAMRVRLPEIDLTVDFARGEDVRTEISAKFRRPGLARELASAGFELCRWWTDGQGRFAVSAARATLDG